MKTKFNKILILTILFLFALILPTFSKAAEFFCTDPNDGCYKYGIRTIRGIYHAMRKDPTGWLTAPIPANAYTENWGLEGNPYDSEVSQGLEMIHAIGGLCVGHRKTSIGQGTLIQKIARIVDVDENTKSQTDLLLGYAAYKSISAGETGYSPMGKRQIRKWALDNAGLNQTGLAINGALAEYATEEALQYASTILNQQMTTTSMEAGTNARQQITVKNGHTYIGPYNFTSIGGELTTATVLTKEGAVYETQYCSIDGNTVDKLSAHSSYAGNNFYIVLQNTTISSVSKVTIHKKFEVIKARVVFTENIMAQGQNVGIFYANKTEDGTSCELPGVPYSRVTLSKIDKDTGKKLAGVGLVLYNESRGGYLVQGTPCTFTSDINKATEFITVKGDLTIENVPASGKYIVYETKALVDQGYEEASKSNPIRVGEFTISTLGQNTSIVIENKKVYMNVSIIKRDQDTGKELSGIGIVLYDVNEGKYVLDGKKPTYVTDIKQATVYKTKVGGIEIKHIKRGHTYRVYEVVNPLFGYKEVSLQNPLYLTEFTTSRDGKKVTVTANNKREYIKLSGYAWEDKVENKNSTPDGLWNSGTYDKRLQYVNVRLKKADGTVMATTTTDVNGEYKFGNYDENSKAVKIRINDLVGAYVEFEYNGMSYGSIRIDTSDNGNKASDTALRNPFNANYATISKDISSNVNGNKVYDIHYHRSNHTSTVNYGNSSKYGYTGQTYPISGVDVQYIIQAITTKKANNILYTSYTADSIRKAGIEEISNINLGVAEREMPDVSVVQDMKEVQISLNNYTHTYKYSQRFENPQNYAGGDGFNVTVKFANKYLSNSYSREVYSSDIVYNQQPGNEGKLKVYVTYSVRIRNESTNLYSTVKTLANYYDARYENITVRNAKGSIIQSSTDNSYHSDGLKRLNINLNQQIEHGKTEEITITYQLNNDAINHILNGNVTLNSTTEVTAYSTYSDNNYRTAYAGIDVDSAPDNVTPTNEDTYEDDTDKAPSLILQLKEGRAIQGKVWEDSAIQELLDKSGYDKERKGNGIYETAENIVNNVKVELMKVTESGELELASLYKKDKTVIEASQMTSGKGDYSFEGVIPSNYVLRYTYGNDSVIVDAKGNVVGNVDTDNYKSTIYRGGNKDATNAMTDYWYRGETSNTNTPRLSDAKDNDKFINDRITEDEINYQIATQGVLTEIYAETRKFDIKLDYGVNMDNISKYGEQLKFVFDNIDFGIIERPKQSLIVDKQIGNVQISLANGTSIIDGDPRTQYLSGVKVLDDDVFIEIDNEIIQGATLKITYEITVDNSNCEIDYNNKDYYIYGFVPANNSDWKIATVVDMLDYLPEEVVLESSEGNNWERMNITQNMKGVLLSEEVYKAVEGMQNIIHLKNPIFENMKPGSEAIDTSMVVSRQLSTTTDDLTYENDVEISKLKGRKTLDSIPGNYNPKTNTPNEVDDDDVEVTITGPTGEDKQYIRYGMIGISVLVIIGIGIIIIKKSVLKK